MQVKIKYVSLFKDKLKYFRYSCWRIYFKINSKYTSSALKLNYSKHVKRLKKAQMWFWNRSFDR